MLNLQRFVWSVAVSTLASCALAADSPPSSADKARDALRILQSEAAPQEKARACKQLAIYGTPEAVPALAGLLSNPQLASWARIALEAIPGPAADDALRTAIAGLQGKLLVGVINSIGVRGHANAVDALATKLNDADVEVASAAAVALGRIGGAQAAEALVQSLANGPTQPRSAVAQGCILCAERFLADGQDTEAVRLYDAVRQANVPKQRILEATRGSILARKADGLPLLLQTLRAADRSVFGMGLSAARELPGPVVTEALAVELRSTAPERQAPLLLAVADRTDSAALPAVLAAVKSGPKPLQLVAIGVLEKRSDPAFVPVLLDLLAERDADLVSAARTALARLPGEVVDEQLSVRLAQVTGNARRVLVELAGQRHVAAASGELIKATQDADPAIRAAGIGALGAIASRQRVAAAVPAFMKAANDTDPTVRAAGLKALGATADVGDLGALTGLLATATSASEVAAVETALASVCRRIPDKDAGADPLLAALASSAAPGKGALLRVLGSVGTTKALDAVRSALVSQDATVQDAAVRVLADWPDVAALPPLLEVFRATKNSTHQFLVLRGCVRLLELGSQPSQQTVNTFGQLLAGAQSADDRKVILSGLGNVPDPAALQLVEPLRANPAIRAEAELAMLNIAASMVGSDAANAKTVATKLQAESEIAATRDRAAGLLGQIDKLAGFITAWQASGPYTEPAQGGSLFDTAFSPEQAGGNASWRLLPSGTQAERPWMVDLLAAWGGEHRVGYARTWIYSTNPQPARLEYGTDDGHKLWLNGQLIHEANRGGAAVPGDFKSEVQLRQGWNLLLLKVTQDTGPWEFCLRICSPSGGALPNVRVRSVPPQE
ncbi:MAG: HEAT repeat domain-containing protein [Limisphaerales bacterium]